MQRIKYWLSFIHYIQRRYVADGCKNSAAALTYMSLFAVVPLMTVMYSVLSIVPSFQAVGNEVQNFIFSNFVPATGQEVQGYLETFSQQARTLTGVGIAFLAVTALLMLKNIEQTFNAIWRTRDNRRGVSSFLLYWAVLSLGPIFIGLALGISTYLISAKVLVDHVDSIGFGMGSQLLKFSPYLLTSAAFTLLFVAVPNCRVPLKHGLIGGLLTALAFEVAKFIFTTIVANSNFQLIYGTFAAIPLFLMWIYLSWLIVLAGAEVVRALSGFEEQRAQQFSPLIVALALLELLWRKYRSGSALSEKEILHRPWLFDSQSISGDSWVDIRDKLLDGGLLRAVNANSYILGRDLNAYSLWELSTLIGCLNEHSPASGKKTDSWFTRCDQLLVDASEKNHQTLNVSLASLFASPTENDK